MHAKPDLRVVLNMDDRWFGLGDRGRYPASHDAKLWNSIPHVLCFIDRGLRCGLAIPQGSAESGERRGLFLPDQPPSFRSDRSNFDIHARRL